MWKVLVVILLLVILIGINYLVVESLWWWGYFQTTYGHNSGRKCHRLPGTEEGSHSVIYMPEGFAIISSGPRKGNGKNTEGKIFIADMTSQQPNAEELTIDYKNSDFKIVQPLGMSKWIDPADQDRIYLYVISRHPQQTVSKFLFDKSAKKLTYENRIANESAFVSLTDVVLVGKDQFYFSNDKKYCYTMELLFRLSFGSIGFYNNGSATLLEENLFVPNGLAVSPNKKFLYVGMGGSREIRVYTILDDWKLKFNNSFKVSTFVTDLSVHPTISGEIWISAMPTIYKTWLYYYKNHTENSTPSQVMRVKMLPSGRAENIEEVYSNNGTEISAASSVVVYGDTMLIGTIMADAYYCRP